MALIARQKLKEQPIKVARLTILLKLSIRTAVSHS